MLAIIFIAGLFVPYVSGTVPIEYLFDYKDDLIEKTDLSDGGYSLKYIYKYDYDEKNNWIKRIDFGGDTPKYIIERQIEYY